MNREDFKQELETLINRFSLENGSDTPDFILASYLWDCLNAFNHAVSWREDFNGRKSNMFVKCPEPLVNCLNTIDQPVVSGSLPPHVKFELQKIALADDEMASNPQAGIIYRNTIRDLLEPYCGNDR